MGDVVELAGRRRARALARAAAPTPKAEFFFDLSCPFSYLAAESVERAFGRVTWRPAAAAALARRDPSADVASTASVRGAAERRAAVLRLPLEWPERFPAEVPAAMRACTLAIEQGRGGPFVLAAVRLAFCGGFDLDDPEILAEAAAAAGVGLGRSLKAAGDPARDATIDANGRRLLSAGADRLPALRVGRSLVWGEERVAGVTAAAGGAAAVERRRS